MIQDLNGKVFDNAYKNLKPNKNDYVLCYKDKEVYLIDNNIPKVADIDSDNLVYGFSIDDDIFYICLDEIGNTPINIFRTYNPHHLGFAIITGYHLSTFYADNKYCSICATKLEKGSLLREMVCPKCKKEIFPRINPAVIVGIINKGRILLTKYNRGYSNYALVAGYAEIGETLEECVKREVLEEVGLHVDKINYYKSQPWGQSGSILAGFFVTISDIDDTITLEEDELKEGNWFKPDEITIENDNISMTREMIMLFKEGKVDEIR